MPNEDNKKFKYNHWEKSLKVSDIIYFDIEYLLKEMYSCQNNPEKFSAEKKFEHEPSGYSLFRLCSFDVTKNELNFNRGRDCMKKLCEGFRDLAMKINNYKEKEMIPLTNEETKFYEKQKVCHICKKEFSTDKNDKNTFKLYHKVRDHWHYTGKFRGMLIIFVI